MFGPHFAPLPFLTDCFIGCLLRLLFTCVVFLGYCFIINLSHVYYLLESPELMMKKMFGWRN